MQHDGITLSICGWYRQECKSVLAALGEHAITVAPFPPRLYPGPESSPPPPEPHKNRITIGCTCVPPHLKEQESNSFFALEQCMHLFLPAETVAAFQAEGYYLVTPGWLQNWPAIIAEWGFDSAGAKQFFAPFSAGILLLDTGVGSDSAQAIAAFADFVGRPYKIIPVGLDYFTLRLEKWISQSRHAASRTEKATNMNRQTADYAMALDLLGEMVNVTREDVAISNTLDLFNMLFAPGDLALILFDQAGNLQAIHGQAKMTKTEQFHPLLTALRTDPRGVELAHGFLLPLLYQETMLGGIIVDELAFPEYRFAYMNLALQICRVIALVINNARQYTALRQSRARYQQLFSQSMNGIAVVNPQDGTFLEINAAGITLLDRSLAQLQEMDLAQVMGLEREETAVSAIQRLMQRDDWQFESYLKPANGPEIPVLVSAGPIELENQLRLLLIWHNITDRRKLAALELERERMRVALVHEKALAEQKADFVTTVSHEFRTPLAIILTAASLLESYEEQMTSADRRHHWQQIQEQIDLLESLLQKVWQYDQITAVDLPLQKTDVDLPELCRELAAEMANNPLISNPILLDLSPQLPPIHSDRRLLRIALLELLHNGAKFSSPAQPIRLTAELLTSEGVALHVQDEGKGIPAQDQDKIFKPFARGSNIGTIRGEGMGLTVAQQIIQRLHGELRYETSVDSGSTFTVLLPIGNR